MFRSCMQHTRTRHCLGTTGQEGIRKKKKICFALHFKQIIFALVGISISDIGFSSLTYFWAIFLVQCLWKASEPPLRCLAKSSLRQGPLKLQLLAQMSLENKGENTCTKSHFLFLAKAFEQRHLETGLGPFSPKIFKTLNPLNCYGK